MTKPGQPRPGVSPAARAQGPPSPCGPLPARRDARPHQPSGPREPPPGSRAPRRCQGPADSCPGIRLRRRPGPGASPAGGSWHASPPPGLRTLTQRCLPTGAVQLLAVVFERNAILRWGEKTAVGEGSRRDQHGGPSSFLLHQRCLREPGPRPGLSPRSGLSRVVPGPADTEPAPRAQAVRGRDPRRRPLHRLSHPRLPEAQAREGWTRGRRPGSGPRGGRGGRDSHKSVRTSDWHQEPGSCPSTALDGGGTSQRNATARLVRQQPSAVSAALQPRPGTQANVPPPPAEISRPLGRQCWLWRLLPKGQRRLGKWPPQPTATLHPCVTTPAPLASLGEEARPSLEQP